MKVASVAFALLVGAASASAQEADLPRRLSQADAVRLLANPAAQDLIAQQIASLAGIVLDTRVGPLATLADPRDGARPDDTLHSIAKRRDPDLDRHLYEKAHGVVAAAGTVAGGAMLEAAELHRTADRLRIALSPLVAAADALKSDQSHRPN